MWLSPSKARMWVAMRSRNQRSWLMTTAQPAKFSKASSSARIVFTSRSLVGSSSSNTFAPDFNILARCTRLIHVGQLDRLAGFERAAIGLFLSGNQPKERRLASAVRPDHADDAAGRE